jgi:hypothetical protein
MADLNPLAFQQAQQAAIGVADNVRQNRLQQFAMQRAEDQYQQEQAANRLYAAAVGPDGTIDRTKLVTGFAQGGLGSKIPALQTQFSAQDKSLREADKAKLESIKQHVELQGQLLGGVRDQASYDQARQMASQAGIDISQLPPQYDPAFVQQAQQKALSASQQVDQMWKQRGYDLDQQKFAYQQQNDSANRGVQLRGQDLSADTARRGQDVTVRGQDLTNARAGEAAKTKDAQAEKTRTQDANDALGLIDMADKLLNDATGSRLGNAIDVGAGALGISTSGAQAGAQLKALEGALVSKMPKMSGPQSDKDVLLYRQMAAQIGDANLPIATRRAALNTVRQIQQKYAAGSSSGPTAKPKPSLSDIFGN